MLGQVCFDVGADMWRHHHNPTLAALRRVDPCSPAGGWHLARRWWPRRRRWRRGVLAGVPSAHQGGSRLARARLDQRHRYV